MDNSVHKPQNLCITYSVLCGTGNIFFCIAHWFHKKRVFNLKIEKLAYEASFSILTLQRVEVSVLNSPEKAFEGTRGDQAARAK